mmetsp:Transcript_43340/g.139263  ORF Transcript_43340/g.139263 Transcript_43340/m.139263 type:complete len:498 (+) Transcript_43340:59-1552(+)
MPALGAFACAVTIVGTCTSSAWVQPGTSTGLSQQVNSAVGRLRGVGIPGSAGESEARSTLLPMTVGLGSLCIAMQAFRGRVPAQRRGAARVTSVAAIASSEAEVVDVDPALVEADGEEEDVEVIEVEMSVSRAEVLRGAAVAVGGATAAAGMASPANAEENLGWVQYDLNTGETLYDIDFDTDDPLHGFVVGARSLFYETKDGGKRWVSRSFANLSKGQDVSYRFQAVTVKGDDVWIVGKPPLLLHSKDSGKTWKKVPVSRKLPGLPQVMKVLAPGKAELATSSGAVYVTDNDGKNFKSIVKETVDATLNRVSSSGVNGASYFTGSVKSIKRTQNGKYLAVASRGNFFLTYTPGEARWVPHNRISARRIQAMGFRDTANNDENPGVWMTLNGGYFTQATDEKYDDIDTETKKLFDFSSIRTGGIGIIDAAFRSQTEGWAVGGSGVIYFTTNGGKTWQFDSSGTELPCNLYNVKFFNNGKIGYMIGSAGILLRKVFEA